jgi:hypothetical protein
MIWLRGKATYREGAIVLDPGSTREYRPNAEGDHPTIAFELAAVTGPKDAGDFARRFGLLRHGPGSDSFREPWSEWEATVARLRDILGVYANLTEARQGNEDAMSYVLERFRAPAGNTDEALRQASIYIGDEVSAGLAEVGLAFQAEADLRMPDGSPGRVGVFHMSATPNDLVEFAYSGLALWLSRSVPARVCEGCGRVFAVKDPRQRFHDPRCSQRARYRRFTDRKEGAT